MRERGKALDVRLKPGPVSPPRVADIEMLITEDVNRNASFIVHQPGCQDEKVAAMVNTDLHHVAVETNGDLPLQEPRRNASRRVVQPPIHLVVASEILVRKSLSRLVRDRFI